MAEEDVSVEQGSHVCGGGGGGADKGWQPHLLEDSALHYCFLLFIYSSSSCVPLH